MHKRNYYIVNAITFYRLIAAPVLLLLIVNHRIDIFKWLLALSFFTDVIDGFFARRYKVISAFGAKIDSIADDLTIVAAMVGVIVFKPAFFSKEIMIFIVLLALFIVQTVLAISHYKKISSFHTYAAKIAAILQGIFLLLLFFLTKPIYILFYTTSIITGLELIEEIIITLLLPQWETNVKGLYWVIKKKKNIPH